MRIIRSSGEKSFLTLLKKSDTHTHTHSFVASSLWPFFNSVNGSGVKPSIKHTDTAFLIRPLLLALINWPPAMTDSYISGCPGKPGPAVIKVREREFITDIEVIFHHHLWRTFINPFLRSQWVLYLGCYTGILKGLNESAVVYLRIYYSKLWCSVVQCNVNFSELTVVNNVVYVTMMNFTHMLIVSVSMEDH